MDDYRDLFCFSCDKINSYRLGSAQVKSGGDVNLPTCKSLKEEMQKIQTIMLLHEERLSETIEKLNEQNQLIEKLKKQLENVEQLTNKHQAALGTHSKGILEIANQVKNIKRKQQMIGTPNKKQKLDNSKK